MDCAQVPAIFPGHFLMTPFFRTGRGRQDVCRGLLTKSSRNPTGTDPAPSSVYRTALRG